MTTLTTRQTRRLHRAMAKAKTRFDPYVDHMDNGGLLLEIGTFMGEINKYGFVRPEVIRWASERTGIPRGPMVALAEMYTAMIQPHLKHFSSDGHAERNPDECN